MIVPDNTLIQKAAGRGKHLMHLAILLEFIQIYQIFTSKYHQQIDQLCIMEQLLVSFPNVQACQNLILPIIIYATYV